MIALEIQLDINAYIKQGLSCSEIVRRTSLDRRTVKGYIDHPERINRPRRSVPRASKVDRYRDEIASLLDDDIAYQASTIYDKLKLNGYEGCYRGSSKRVVPQRESGTYPQGLHSVRDGSGAPELQVDFGEFMVIEMPDGTVKKFYLFAMSSPWVFAHALL